MMHFSKPLLGTQLDWSNPLNDGLVMHLAANEGHGDKIQDLSLNGNHGTMQGFAFPPNAASGWNPGWAGVGLNFDSVGSNYIGCGNAASLDITDALTISASIRPTLLAGDNRMLIGKGSDYYQLGLQPAGTVWFRICNTASVAKTQYSNFDLNINTNYNIVATFDGTDMKVFVNGIDVSWGDITQTDIKTSLAQSLEIGRRPIANDDHFNGSIDQPRIQSRALSAREVKDYAINPWQVYLDAEDM